MPDLAGADQVNHAVQHLVSRCEAIPQVHPVHVDAVSAEPTQRPLPSPGHVRTAGAAAHRSAASREPVRRRQHDAVADAAFGEQSAEQLLACAACITSAVSSELPPASR